MKFWHRMVPNLQNALGVWKSRFRMGPRSNSLKALARVNAELTSFQDRFFLLRTWLTDRETRLLLSLDLFDPEFYLANNADIRAAKVDPLIHYLRWGKKEGRKPSADVDTSALFKYLRAGSRPARADRRLRGSHRSYPTTPRTNPGRAHSRSGVLGSGERSRFLAKLRAGQRQ